MSVLPPGWVWTDTGSVAEVQGGIQKQPKRAPRSNRYPFLRVANVLRGHLNLQQVHEIELFDGELDRFRLHHGDLLVVEGNGSPNQIGRAALWLGEIDNCVHQNHLIRVRPTGAINPKYLTYYWNASRTTEHLRSVASSTSGLYVLTAAKVRAVRVPLPPLREQDRIISAIEEQYSRIDAGRTALGRVQQDLKRMRSAVLLQAFAAVASASKLLSGRELFSFITSGSRGWAKYYSAEGPAFLRISNVPRSGIEVDLRDIQHVQPPPNAEGIRTKVQPGDVAISITAELGRVAVIPSSLGEAYINQHVALARPAKGLEPRYLAWYLASPFGIRQWSSLRRGATKVGLGLDDIRAVRVPVPDASLQRATVDRIEREWTILDAIDEVVANATSRSEGLRSSILSAAFSGNLVPQDPEDEAASVLLERVARQRQVLNDYESSTETIRRTRVNI